MTHYEVQLYRTHDGSAIGPAYSGEAGSHGVKVRRQNQDGTRTTCWLGPINQLGDCLYEAERLASYVATVQLKNRRPWLDGLAERMNALLERLSDPDRVRVEKDHFVCEKIHILKR